MNSKNSLLTLTLGFAFFASCTLQKDAQHGISLGFRGPNPRNHSEVRDQPERVIAKVNTPLNQSLAIWESTAAEPQFSQVTSMTEYGEVPSEVPTNSHQAPPLPSQALESIDPLVEANNEELDTRSVVSKKNLVWTKMSPREIFNFLLEGIIKLVLAAALGFFVILIAVSTMVAGFYLPWFLIGIGGLIGVFLLAFALAYWGIIHWGPW
ncbi:MAG: hypothetical protein NWR91_00805 [Schleiferiaceae bacterium]|jgi:hypothetical protein|nr:hypothetical protein [Schleiferiaceae bacterium]MDP4741974.1 hypothetical protein [Schleiferiaceae bacterium]